MTGQAAPPVDRPELAGALERALTSCLRRPCRIVVLRARPYVYSTSFRLEELEVGLDDGTRLDLVFKYLGRAGMLPDARRSKPAFLYDPLREIEAYADILPLEALGTARCYGTFDDGGPGLLLEKVTGRELYQVGEQAVWHDVARWLAGMHDRFADHAGELHRTRVHLIRYDAGYYRRWLDRARTALGDGDAAEEQRCALGRVGAGLEGVLERLATMPVTFLHGEMYASNVLVAEGVAGRRVCAVDWEMAGLGPGLLDVAALCSGWDEGTSRALALTYRAALRRRPGWPPGDEEFLVLLDSCSLCVAVQWLGWSPGWSPPRDHARDWLGHAVRLAERLGS
ncbi:phosphotransferase family protein [Geodermatophilus sp. SYSU D00703]